MFDISSLQYNSANPGFTSILITVMSSMILGVLLAFTYEKTSRDVNRPNHFLQALILITIVAATVIQAIGDSVARGLGMIGALSIIRFRTTIKDPRNLVFMFGAIAVGVATGVFGFMIAVIGTLGFCATAFLLYFSSFSPKNDFIGSLKLGIDNKRVTVEDINKIMKVQCRKFKLVKQALSIDKLNPAPLYDQVQLSYDLKLKTNKIDKDLIESLTSIEGVSILKYSMDRNTSVDI